MDKFPAKWFTGDPGVPHTGPERFVGMWSGIAALSAVTWFTPRFWNIPKAFNHQDKALRKEQNYWKKMLEHDHWKKIMKKQPALDNSMDGKQVFQLK